jgi:tetratricopeptide (TPR) repeat protein
MKKMLAFSFLAILFCLSATAQKISRPLLTAKPATASQKALIQQGIALHDAKQYDAAIQKYKEVLAENPDCTLALYELALTFYSKPDKNKAMDTALKGAEYRSDELPLFYGIIANVADDQGKPKEAIRLYEDAIKIVKAEKELQHHLSSLHYNLGVTHTRQKQFKEARETLKKAVEYDFRYASPHYVLAEVFYASKYQIPALLAAGRLLSLEINSQRSKRATAILLDILKAPQKDGQGNTTIFLNMGAPTDEGDFGAAELILGMGGVRTEEDKGKSDNEIFAEKVSLMVGLLVGDKKLPSTFVGKNYLPFFAEMKNRGYLKHFAYLILQQSGNSEAEKWLIDEGRKTADFINWAKSYPAAK